MWEVMTQRGDHVDFHVVFTLLVRAICFWLGPEAKLDLLTRPPGGVKAPLYGGGEDKNDLTETAS